MKTQSNVKKTSYNFQRSTYNPALDHLMGKDFFKEKMEEAREFIKKHGLPVITAYSNYSITKIP